jgi:hypothetical protein
MTAYSNSSKMSVNVMDYIGLPVFVILCAISLGLIQSSPFGLDLATAVYEPGAGHSFTIANLGAILTLGYVAYTNDWDGAALTGTQIWVVIATVGLIVAPPFYPPLAETLAGSTAAMIALLIQIGGYVTFSFLG